MKYAIGRLLSVTGGGILAISAIAGFLIALGIVYDLLGFLGIVAGILLAPVLLVAAPFYAGLADGNWIPLLITYGGGILGLLCREAGKSLIANAQPVDPFTLIKR